MIVKGLLSTRHPVLVHIIPVRRCNLACTYCNEFDDFSKPVPLEEMFRRIDRLGAMGTSVITISGGEPLLHPELDAIIARIRKNGIMAGLITNGYLLIADRIKASESRRPGISANQHRQRQPGRRVHEKPESSRPETEAPGRARRISGQHQFRARRRRRQFRGRPELSRTAPSNWALLPPSGSCTTTTASSSLSARANRKSSKRS